jgi:DNA-binding beta-propeller fold protein YncE
MAKTLACLLLAVVVSGQTLAAQEIDLAAAQAAEEFRWGVRAYHGGHFEQAILSIEKSLSYKPQDMRSRTWLGLALYRAGFEEAALNEWRYVLDREPGNAVVQNLVQVVSFRRGLGTELEQETPVVVATEIDGNRQGYHPFRRPSGVFVRRDGSVYLVGFASDEILLLDANHAVRSVLRGDLRGYDRPFQCIEVGAASGEGASASGGSCLFISEYGRNRVLKTTLNGDRLGEIGGTGSGPGQLLGPQYLAADGKGYLYVSDWGNARVNKYNLKGEFILSVGAGNPSGQRLREPTGVAFSGGYLYVAQRAAGNIAVFDESGNYVSSIGEGVLKAPEGLAFMGPQLLLVADANRVLQYRLPTQTWKTLIDMSASAGHLTHLALSPNGEIYATDFNLNKVYVLCEMGALYTNLFVQAERVVSDRFPEVLLNVSVEDRRGNPVLGLQAENFTVTEGFQPVSGLELLRAPGDPAPLEVALVVEKSPAMTDHAAELGEAVQMIHQGLSASGGKLTVISAGEQAAVEAELGTTRLASKEAALKPPWTPLWRLDRGMRLAVSLLQPDLARKAVVLLTTGSVGAQAFGQYSLAEVTDYLQNNAIPLYVVHFGGQPDRELPYMASETRGGVYDYLSPQSIAPLIPGLLQRLGSQYLLRYTSRSSSAFGKTFIELQVEAVLHRKSGRTESGYFAPLSD